nr:unnamed protein product [Callosobruchus analis]
MDGVDGVLFVRKPDGRATGDAFVLFAEESDSPKALTKHRECIGARYIELFRSTTAEVQQVLNRSMDSKPYDPVPLLAQLPLPVAPFLPQSIITSGTRKDCIRLRGLPYEAQVEHILEFLEYHAKNIVFRGVHMVYNAQVMFTRPAQRRSLHPNGLRAFRLRSRTTETPSLHDLRQEAALHRGVPVFGEDMNLVLTGGLPSHPRVVSPAAAPKPPATAAVRAVQAHAAVAAAAAHDMLSLGSNQLIPPAAAAAPAFGPPPPGTSFGAVPPPNAPPAAAFTPVQMAPPAAAVDPHQFVPPQIFYWPYPSPPGSPTGYYPATGPCTHLPGPPHYQPQLLPADWPLQHLRPIPILVEAALHRPDPEKTGQNIEPNPCVEILI